LLFIFIFNLYLFKSTSERINLYYSLYVLFACLFTLTLDGFLYMTNSIWLLKAFSIIKWAFPSLGIFYLLAFSQLFLKTSEKLPRIDRLFNILKATSIICLLLLFIPVYPINIVPEIILNVMLAVTFIINILVSIISYNKDYLPFKFFLSAFLFMALAALFYLLRDISILKEGLITDNSIRFGLLLQTILLTIAVLERFRLQQEDAKKTIQDSYEKIQDQKNQLLEINTELEKLSVVASETENSVAIYDIEGNMEWCNAGFERIYDTTLEELKRNGEHNIKYIIAHSNIKSLVDYSIANKQPVFFENNIKTKRKKQVWLQTTITPYISKESNLTKLIAIDSDISELKLYERNLTRAKEKAEESDRLKTSFLANMSHEIRTPLNGIIGFGGLLKKDNLPVGKREKYLDIIDKNGEQLLKLIDDILDISLIESNQLKTNISKFDPDKIMDEIYEYFQLFKKEIRKDYLNMNISKPDKKLLSIESDPDRLRQVLNNLLNNAFKFTEKGFINFGYIIKNSNLEFFVEDSGPGIDEDIKPLLFKRFAQGEETLKRSHGGAGLGLSISKGIIKLLGGKIWYDEKYRKGARFCFTLPK
jgi:signal transduction histidine kinase